MGVSDYGCGILYVTYCRVFVLIEFLKVVYHDQKLLIHVGWAMAMIAVVCSTRSPCNRAEINFKIDIRVCK